MLISDCPDGVSAPGASGRVFTLEAEPCARGWALRQRQVLPGTWGQKAAAGCVAPWPRGTGLVPANDRTDWEAAVAERRPLGGPEPAPPAASWMSTCCLGVSFRAVCRLLENELLPRAACTLQRCRRDEGLCEPPCPTAGVGDVAQVSLFASVFLGKYLLYPQSSAERWPSLFRSPERGVARVDADDLQARGPVVSAFPSAA